MQLAIKPNRTTYERQGQNVGRVPFNGGQTAEGRVWRAILCRVGGTKRIELR